MIDTLREAFPQIDWHEDKRTFVSIAFVGALNERFCIVVFADDRNKGFSTRYSAQLRWTDPVRIFHANFMSGSEEDPVEAVKTLQHKILAQEAAFEAFWSRF